MLTIFNIHHIPQSKYYINHFDFFWFQIEHTADDWPHILHLEKNHKTARSVEFTLYATGSVIGSERSSFLIDNYIYVNKND